MPRYILAWRSSAERFFMRVAVRPVSPEHAAEVDRLVDPDEVEALLEELDEICLPPWCTVVEVEAEDLAEAEDRARGWHFT